MDDEVTKIHFNFTEQIINTMTTEEYEAFERAQDGEFRMYRLRPVMARFMVNGDGQTPINHDRAMKVLGDLPFVKQKDVIEAFTNALQNKTVPKANGNLSKSPSEATSEVSEFPDGSGN